MAVTWAQALSWRLGRHQLDPIGTESVAGVVHRLGAVAAQFDDAAELAIRARQRRSQSGEVAGALAEGTIIKTFAFRGATHLMTPEDAGAYLALRSASKMWELPSWQEHYGVKPSDWPALLDAVREALADGPLTTAELGTSVTRKRRFHHLGFAFGDGGSNLLKPIAWHGAMSFGPPRNGRATFQALESNPRWAGVPPLDEGGMRAVEAYFRTYGPATPDHLQYWLGRGLSAGRKRIAGWFAELGDRLTEIEIDGAPSFILTDDLDSLLAARPSKSVRFLPGYDQWILGPGTVDAHIVPPPRRGPISRKANLVVHGGVVSGSWESRRSGLLVTWFAEMGRTPRRALLDEAARISDILGQPLDPQIEQG